jgi:carbon-monoxide dehydrogenase medium subunit
VLRLPAFRLHQPPSLAEAAKIVAGEGDTARVVAGGTDLWPNLKRRHQKAEQIVSLTRIAELRGVHANGDLRIGAMETLTEVEGHAAVHERFPALARAVGWISSPLLRNMGTIGGNLCYAESASDPAPALLALGARAVVQGRSGRRVLPLAEGFYLGFFETSLEPGEILVELEVPRQPGGPSTYVKWSPRSLEDKALVGLAAVLDADGDTCRELRLGLGGVNPTPIRLPRAEAAARGQRLTDETIAAVARAATGEIDPLSDVQGSADYRREMVGVWVTRALRGLCGRAPSR